MIKDKEINKRALQDELTEVFIVYQHRLDLPFPSSTETPALMRARYMNDPVFRARVVSLVGGVLCIVNKHI